MTTQTNLHDHTETKVTNYPADNGASDASDRTFCTLMVSTADRSTVTLFFPDLDALEAWARDVRLQAFEAAEAHPTVPTQPDPEPEPSAG